MKSTLNTLETKANKDERFHISFRATDTMKKEIKDFTETHGISISALTRFAIVFYLNMNSNKSLFYKLSTLINTLRTMKQIEKEVSKSPK